MSTISFEFFPPKNIEASFRLADTVSSLAPYDPTFVSVTYGAGGTTRALTHDAVAAISSNYGLNVAAHLTCVDATKGETLEIAKSYAKSGVTEIVALRGDPPKGAANFAPRADGFASSVELIEALSLSGQFTIRVGAYPEKHPEAADMTANIEWLKRKFEAGADSAITQFFFEADTFFRFRDACADAGIKGEIVPGILPIENWKGASSFARRCGTAVPLELAEAFEKAERDDRSELLALAQCTELCTELLEGGVEHLHFYTLNKPTLTRDVLHALGHAPRPAVAAVA